MKVVSSSVSCQLHIRGGHALTVPPLRRLEQCPRLYSSRRAHENRPCRAHSAVFFTTFVHFKPLFHSALQRATPQCIVRGVLRGRIFPGVCILARQRSSISLIAHDVDGGIFRERREVETTQRRRHWQGVETMMDGWVTSVEDRQIDISSDEPLQPDGGQELYSVGTVHLGSQLQHQNQEEGQ